MKLYVRNGAFQAGSFFKFVFVGVLIGEGLIMGIPVLIAFGVMTLAGAPVHATGPEQFWLVSIMIPLIILMHAVMFAGMIVFGIWLYSRFGKLEIAEEA